MKNTSDSKNTNNTYNRQTDRDGIDARGQIKKLQQFIDASDNIVFFGGAGVSTESGVPDFRSKNGLYNQHDVRFDSYSPEYLLSSDCLENEPKVFFEFYRQKMDARFAGPNAAHLKLAELEAAGKLKAVVTQNIDGLHQAAGSRNVYELHGSTLRNYCPRCRRQYPPDYIFDSAEPVPRCQCGGIIRPDVTLYGESLPEKAVWMATAAISEADLLIIGGTSLTVYPAASYVRFFRGQHLVIINLETTPLATDRDNTLFIRGKIGEVLSCVSVAGNA